MAPFGVRGSGTEPMATAFGVELGNIFFILMSLFERL